MSHHDPSHDNEQHAEAHADEHHEEPPPPDEPRTPAWLTVLGVGMFVVAGMWFLATRPAGKTVEELRPAPQPAASASAAVAIPAKPGPVPEGQPAPVRPNLQVLRPTRPGPKQ